jgi:hypothetical protein
MSGNPYTPPKAQVGSPAAAAPELQARAIAAVLLVWGVAGMVMSAYGLLVSGGSGLPLSYFYLFTAEPILLLAAAYLLWTLNKFGALLLALALAARIGVAAAFRFDFSSRTTSPYLVELFSRIPLAYLLPTAIGLALLFYCLYMIKVGHLK